MRVRVLGILIGFVLMALFLGLTGAEEAKKARHDYIGVKKCVICHKKDGIAASWEATKHATAWDNLSEEDKKNEALKPFYTTGIDAKGELLTGIQCEACHGPGSDYKTNSIMKDREKAIANGLLIPDEKTCLKCHNDKAPTAALAATAKDFDYEKLKLIGSHAAAVKGKEAENKE